MTPPNPAPAPLSRQQIVSRAFAAFLNKADPLNNMSLEDRNRILGEIGQINLQMILKEIEHIKTMTDDEVWDALTDMHTAIIEEKDRLQLEATDSVTPP